MKKCYHFCSVEFLNELKKLGEIKPDRTLNKGGNRLAAYNYLFDKVNNGNGLFFSWSSIENKDENIEYTDKSNTVLLELNVPDEYAIETDYYNWCDVIYCLDDHENYNDEVLAEAEQIAQEEMHCSFDTIFNSIFDKRDNCQQTLLRTIKSDWIVSIKYVKDKII